MIYIGIDPGVKTGLAIWNTETQKLGCVESNSIIVSMAKCEMLLEINRSLNRPVKIFFEDARQRTWFGKAGREKLQGVGSVKRDCNIWEEFCQYHGIEYEAVHPKNNITKMGATTFKRLTGWSARTSEHSRDAAMLVFGRK